MTASQRRKGAATAAALGLAAGLSGCAHVHGHQGYIDDNALIAAIRPGVDNRESVKNTLGDPSFASQFDKGTWYYVSRQTSQFSFGTPKPVQQTVIAVNFDPNGNVESVSRTGLNKIVHVSPSGDKTPTLGRKRTLAQDLFGNIGATGTAAANAPTVDNPTGGANQP